MEPEVVVDYELKIGENPLWNSEEGMIYWEDIHTGRIFRFDPVTGIRCRGRIYHPDGRRFAPLHGKREC
jgi:sugar lactone lactonase YvrE